LEADMATANRTAPSKARIRKPARRKPAHQPLPDLHGILDRFCCALSVVTVSQIAIGPSDQLAREDCVLRQGIAALDAVYEELDLAIGAINRFAAARGAPG
jgi:hypothetical protein